MRGIEIFVGKCQGTEGRLIVLFVGKGSEGRVVIVLFVGKLGEAHSALRRIWKGGDGRVIMFS